MNHSGAELVPPQAVEISYSFNAADLAVRHERMISQSVELQETLLSDLTTEALGTIQRLIDQIGSDLADCRKAPHLFMVPPA